MQEEKKQNSTKSKKVGLLEFADEEYILLYKAFEYAFDIVQELLFNEKHLYPSVRAQHDVYAKERKAFGNPLLFHLKTKLSWKNYSAQLYLSHS